MFQPTKWTLFWFSLFVPGAGQLAIRNGWGWVWFSVAVALGIVSTWAGALTTGGERLLFGICSLTGIGVALASAEHAKRLLERRSPVSNVVAHHVRSGFQVGRKIDVGISVTLAQTVAEAWQRISNLEDFLTIDPFHDRVILMTKRPICGADLVLSHNLFGLAFNRFGRLLRWDEGCGYAFSDLSGQSPRQGFPHIFEVRLRPIPNESQHTELTIHVRGRWTARWIPPVLGRLWVLWVCREHARLLRKAL